MIIEVSGTADAATVEQAADSFAALVRSWDPDVTVSRRTPPPPPDGDKVVDPVSVAALVLAIPSAVLAVVDIVDRIQKRRRAKQLIDHAKTISETAGVQVILVVNDRRKPLAAVNPDELLDATT